MNSFNSNSVNGSSINSDPLPPPSIHAFTHNTIDQNNESSNSSNVGLSRIDNAPTNEVFIDSFSNNIHSFGAENQLPNAAFCSGYDQNVHFLPINTSETRAPYYGNRSLATPNSEPFKLFNSPTETIQNVNHNATTYSPSFMTNTDVGNSSSRNVRGQVDYSVLTSSILDNTSQSDSSKPYKCPKCDLAFPTSQAFGGHMRSHAYWKNWEIERKLKENGAGTDRSGSNN